jgi:Skp family chaperone for outer membrane proteins
MVTNKMTTTTDTPRTDAVQFQPRPISLTIESEMLRALSRKLERELAASEAEVERLKKELADWDYGTRAKREQEARKKAEAEVERLRSALKLIAAPKRPDGTYNRCREACEKLASKALKQSDN